MIAYSKGKVSVACGNVCSPSALRPLVYTSVIHQHLKSYGTWKTSAEDVEKSQAVSFLLNECILKHCRETFPLNITHSASEGMDVPVFVIRFSLRHWMQKVL